MKESYQKFLDLSLVHFMAYPSTIGGDGPILETLAKIAEDPFFTAVEIGQINDSTVRKDAAKLVRQAGLRVGFGAQPMLLIDGLNLNSPDDDERRKAIDVMKEGINQAIELNAERLGLLSGPAPPRSEDRPEQIKLLIDSLDQICEYAESHGGPGITLETFDEFTDKRALIGNSHEEAVDVARELRKSKRDFGLLVDLSHLPMQQQSPKEALSTTANYLVHAHIGNCVMSDKKHPAYGDLHPRFGIEGGENGVPELVTFLQVLFEEGFLSKSNEEKPLVGIEVSPMEDETPETLIANTKRAFNEAWAKLEVPQ